MTLAPLPDRPSAVDLCAAALRRAILDGTFQPGSRLPPERTLADQFGVHRVTVRGALGRLAGSGLLRARQGSGHRVRDFLRFGGPDLLPGLAELATDDSQFVALAADLLLVRRQLARAVLQRLAESCSEEGRASVADAVERFARAVDDGADDDDLAEADLDVLAALLRATGSPVLGLCLNPVTAALRELPRLRRAIYAEPRGNVDGWRLLVAWLPQATVDGVDVIVGELERRDRETLARLGGRS